MTTSNQQRQQIEQELAAILRESSGLELEQLSRSTTFLELGFDSLFLIQLSQRIKRRMGVKVAFRQLIEDVSTIEGLVDYLAAQAAPQPENSQPTQAVQFQPAPVLSGINGNGSGSGQAIQISTTQSAVVAQSTSRLHAPQSQPTVSPIATVQPSAKPNGQIARQPAPLSTTAQSVIPPASLPTQQFLPRSVFPETSSTASTNGISLQRPAMSSALEQIILQQNELMMAHLELLGRMSTVQTLHPNDACDCSAAASQCNELTCAEIPASSSPTTTQQVNQASDCDLKPTEGSTTESQAVVARPKNFERFGPYKPVRRGIAGGLTEQQHRHLDQFMHRYTTRTVKSRKQAQAHRAHFADPRGVAGYRRIWKSMVYQIVVERSQGSKLWDIDGNEYIDIAMGFGLNLFGQSPTFVTQALHRQLDRGVEVGPQTPLTGEVAALLCQFSRKDRVTFCNTGSEAVMAALRLARTVTGKTKTVYFNKDYHGNFDQVLLRSSPIVGTAGSVPAAPGVPECYNNNTLVLPYGAEESLQIIQQQADDIAAVLVEPVQSADPFVQPREFLHKLREITRQNRIALVMDEVISGFRASPGGAQEWYGVWGDMATYGKVLGGGMPIGALAGSAEYMDALDGGYWQYETDSEPEADMTFFAGTFVRHPLAIAAAYEILKKVKEEGPELQERLTARTTHLTTTLNRFFEEHQFPIRVAQFTSLFRMIFPPDLEYADMLYFHLLDRGIFTRGWGDNCFLSTAHSDDDVQRIIQAVQESCLEIREGGFFPDRETALANSDLEEEKNDAIRLTAATDQTSDRIADLPQNQTLQIQPPQSLMLLQVPSDRMSTINPIQEEGDLPPLFCMPAADGLTLVYHELSHCLGPNQPVYGLDSPAIYREPIPDTLEELSARFIEDMREIQPSGPYLLIGYCSGGTTALEVAQQLLRSGEKVALLAMLETYNWLDAPSTNPTLTVQVHYQFERLKYHLYNFALLSLRDKREFVSSKFRSLLRRTGVWRSAIANWFSSSSVQREGLVNMADIWRKHDDITEAYIPQKYPGTLIHFRPRRDYKCNLGTEYQADKVLLHRLPVYPAGMMANPFVTELAEKLRLEIQCGLDKNQ